MKRSFFSLAVLGAVLAFLYVPVVLIFAYGFVPNGVSMSFFGSNGEFEGFTDRWYRLVFAGHHSVRALLQSFWLSLRIAAWPRSSPASSARRLPWRCTAGAAASRPSTTASSTPR